MKHCFITFISLMILTGNLFAQQQIPTPYLRRLKNHTQLVVDSKPFLIVGGEIHNSSSSSVAYFNAAIKRAKSLNINTLLVPVSWNQFEPVKGKYDYTLIDTIIRNAHQERLKLVILWFGTWKNGSSSYVPLWVKKNPEKFFTVKNDEGKNLTRDGLDVMTISPFCKAAMNADARAFSVLMKRIKEVDKYKTVIMVQVENEVGAFSKMDYSPASQKLYQQEVPQKLMNYLIANKRKLEKPLQLAWSEHGYKEKGTWSEVFGEQHGDAQNIFMAWYYASYINNVCKQGKAAYDLPMYVNAWIVQYDGELPGKYPNGGPVSRVMDIYKAAAPDIDFLSPDIYLSDFKQIISMYHRPNKRNPLFIPECGSSNPGNAYYALAEENAMGFSRFGIELLTSDISYSASFKVLEELTPVIIKYQGTGKMYGILRESNEDSVVFKMGKYLLDIHYNKKEHGYGLIIQTGENEFIIAGIGFKVSVASSDGKTAAAFALVQEGGFKNSIWTTTRVINGDGTWVNALLLAKGRNYIAKLDEGHIVLKKSLIPNPIFSQVSEKDLLMEQVKAPGIYKVTLFQHPW